MHLAGKRCWDRALADGLGLGTASLSFSLEGVEIKLQEEGRAVLRGYELFRLSPFTLIIRSLLFHVSCLWVLTAARAV